MMASPSSVGMASSGTVRHRPLRAPVVVTIATGSALRRLEARWPVCDAERQPVERVEHAREQPRARSTRREAPEPAVQGVGLGEAARHQPRRLRMYFVASLAEVGSVTAPPWLTSW